MARLNVHVPDDLAGRARVEGLNVSALTQAAITRELERRATDAWLAAVSVEAPRVSHADAMDAMDAARAEFGDTRA